MRIAVVHDWLTVFGGAESVLEQIFHLFPNADLFTLIDFMPAQERNKIKGKTIQTSFIQKLPFSKKFYRYYLPWMPLAIEQLDVTNYDLVISSNTAVAKGVITAPGQLHICYCNSPMRYAWDLQFQYLKEAGFERGLKKWILGPWVRKQLHNLRDWDYRTAQAVDYFISNSNFVSQRVNKYYRRDSAVIYPPVDTEFYSLSEEKEDFYLTASRLVPYKKIHLIVEAFKQMPEKKLIVIGDGPEFKKISQSASPNIQLLGYQPRQMLKSYLQRAKAFVFASIEDFGIAPLEAQACGTPVIGYGKGGLLETLRENNQSESTGCLFYEQTADAIIQAVKEFEKNQTQINTFACRKNALRFSIERFRSEFKDFVEKSLAITEIRCKPKTIIETGMKK